MAKVLLFGWFAEKAGWAEQQIAGATLLHLKTILGECHPDIAAALAVGKGRSAVNQSLVYGDAPVNDGDEVAFFPPVSGG